MRVFRRQHCLSHRGHRSRRIGGSLDQIGPFTKDVRDAAKVANVRTELEALERRDTELAERLTRQHTLDLAVHVDRYCTFLE